MTTLALTRRPQRSRVAPDERAARRSLLDQIARLEEELSGLFTSAWPRTVPIVPPGSPARGGARLRTLGDLELDRDQLAARVAAGRQALAERTALEEANRRLIEEMLLEPERYPWVRVSNEDIGEPGCHHWHVLPRWGPLGAFMKWWRVRISSGCPLPMRRCPR